MNDMFVMRAAIAAILVLVGVVMGMAAAQVSPTDGAERMLVRGLYLIATMFYAAAVYFLGGFG